MPTLEEIGARLQDQSVGTVGTDIFLAQVPDNPDDCIVVFPTSGLTAIRSMGTPDLVLQPSIQVQSRSKSSTTARNNIEAARSALHGYSGNLTGGSETANYLDIEAIQSEGSLISKDERDREIWVCNFQIKKERSV